MEKKDFELRIKNFANIAVDANCRLLGTPDVKLGDRMREMILREVKYFLESSELKGKLTKAKLDYVEEKQKRHKEKLAAMKLHEADLEAERSRLSDSFSQSFSSASEITDKELEEVEEIEDILRSENEDFETMQDQSMKLDK